MEDNLKNMCRKHQNKREKNLVSINIYGKYIKYNYEKYE